jgi:VWFA-related protein
VCLLLLCAGIQVAAAQNPTLKTRTKEEREEMYASAHRVTMNVQVTDSNGNPVSDLSAGDFKIFDNDQTRKIAAFHAIDGAAMYDATRIVLLLDAVNSPPETLEAAKDGIFKYLAESRRPFSHPTSFALWFNGHLDATPATTDRNSIGRAFVKLTKGVRSNACEHGSGRAEQRLERSKDSGTVDSATCRAIHFKDSVAALDGIAQTLQSGGGRTLLIWVGTGWPILSEEDFQRLTPKEQREFAQELVRLTHNLRAGQVTLYSISPAAANQNDSGTHLVQVSAPGPVSAIARGLDLRELSQRTGGQVMAASSDIPADLRNCVRDAEWYYAVSFNAPPAQSGPGELHSLEIKVNRPGVRVRTIDTYYIEP